MFFALTVPLGPDPTDAAILSRLGAAEAAGADMVEIEISAGRRLPVDGVRRALERLDIGCICRIARHDVAADLLASERARSGAGEEALREAISIARDLGAKLIDVPLDVATQGSSDRDPTADLCGSEADILTRAQDLLNATGVALAIEPVGGGSIDAARRIGLGVELSRVAASPRIGLSLNVGELYGAGLGLPSSVRLIAPWVRHVRMPDTSLAAPGHSPVDWIGLFAALRSSDYTGGCTLESGMTGASADTHLPTADSSPCAQTFRKTELALNVLIRSHILSLETGPDGRGNDDWPTATCQLLEDATARGNSSARKSMN